MLKPARVITSVVVTAAALSGALLTAQRGTPTNATLAPVAGTWRTAVEDGHPTTTVDGSGASATAPAPAAFSVALAREIADFRAGTISLEFKLISGASDQTAGVVFNHQPNGNYHFARYNTKDGNVAVWKFEGGTRTVLAHGELHEQLALGAWHRLTVTISGTSVVAVANDRLRVAHTLGAPVQGRVGVWTKADSTTAFRRFVVAQ